MIADARNVRASRAWWLASLLLLAPMGLQACGATCEVDGRTYDDGDEWQCGCNTCSCNDGEYGSTRLACVDAGL
jgi:hypothetical protein